MPDEWRLLAPEKHRNALTDVLLTLAAALLLLLGIPSLFGFALAQVIDRFAANQSPDSRTKAQDPRFSDATPNARPLSPHRQTSQTTRALRKGSA